MAEGYIQRSLDLEKVNMKVVTSLSDTTPDKFYVSNSARLLVYTIDSNANRCGEWIIWSYSGGAMGSKTIVSASELTLGGVQNEITVTKANGGYITYLIFELNGSKMNIVS